MEKIKLKLSVGLKGHKEGHVVILNSKDGLPVDPYWRKRIKDSEVDNCVEIVPKSVPKEIEKKSKSKKG